MEKHLSQIAYYMNGVLFFVGLYASIFGLINIKKIGFYSIFLIITINAIIQPFASSGLIARFFNQNQFELYKINFTLYIIVELIVLSIFFYKKLIDPQFKKVLTFLNSTLIVFFISIFLIEHKINNSNITIIAASEAIVILINCIFLFVQILNDEENTTLIKSPDFVITSGIFFLFSFTCPFYMVSNFSHKSESILMSCLNLVNYIGYIFFHLSIIIAFKCKIHSNKLSSF